MNFSAAVFMALVHPFFFGDVDHSTGSNGIQFYKNHAAEDFP